MLESWFLYSWKFWVVLAIIVIILIWLFSANSSGEGYPFVGLDPIDPDKCYLYPGGPDDWSRGPVQPRFVKNRDDISQDAPVVERKSNVPNPNRRIERSPAVHRSPKSPRLAVRSPRDATPRVDPNAEVQHVDLTPAIPQHITEEIEHHQGRMSRGEAKCKEAIEKIYGVPFHKDRPSWLVNPRTGHRMELDLVNHDLKVAVEYNGEQHYKSDHYFHRSFQHFMEQVWRDEVKVDICDENGYYLITVPYNISLDKIEEYIRYFLPEAVAAREYRQSQI